MSCEDEKVTELVRGTTNINDLTSTCLEEIFEYVPAPRRLRLEEVCTKWRDLSERGWRNTKILSTENHEKLPEILMRCGSYLENLEVYNLRFSDEKDLSTIRDECCNLIKLTLKFRNDDLRSVRYRNRVDIFYNMDKLESFTFRVNGSLDKCSGNFLWSLRSSIQELCLIIDKTKSKQIYGNPFYVTLPTHLRRFHSLTSLTLRGIPLSILIPRIITKRSLVKLDISNCKATLTRELCQISNLINLEFLSMRDLKNVTDDVLRSISRNCNNLKRLNINGCKNVTDDGIGELANLVNLEELNIGNIPTIEGTKLSELRNLKILICRDCTELKISSLMLNNLMKLERLDVRGAKITSKNIVCAVYIGLKFRETKIPLFLLASYKNVRDKFRFSGLIAPSLFLSSCYR